MNFIDAAITVLREHGRPMHVEELCREAVRRNLLSRPGPNPLRSMKGRLTTEAKKTDGGMVVRVEPDVWSLRDIDPKIAKAEDAAGDTATVTEEPAAVPPRPPRGRSAARRGARATAGEAREAEPGVGANGQDAGLRAPGEPPEEPAAKVAEGAPEEPDEEAAEKAPEEPEEEAAEKAPEEPDEKAPEEPEEEAAEKPRPARRRGRRRRTEQPSQEAGPSGAGDAASQPGSAGAGVSELHPDEAGLVSLYEDEAAATTPMAELTEYRDEHTADEDRPLLPEIVAKGRGRPGAKYKGRRTKPGGERRGEGEQGEAKTGEKAERRRRGKGRGAPSSEVEAADAAPKGRDVDAPPRAADTDAEAAGEAREAPVQPAELGPGAPGAGDEHAQPDGAGRIDVPGGLRLRPGSPLADGAYDTLAELKSGQAMQVKQLAQMMRKRRRMTGDPKSMWPALKAALLADEEQHRARGLRPRIVHRGRDLFAARAPALPDELLQAETTLESAHLNLLSATLSGLTARLSALDVPALERLAQIYLEREGWGELRWVKRSGRSGYALAEPTDIPGPVLIGVRAGDAPVDRRGVGELRAGLDAKDLPRGLLLAPQELSDEARAELDRRGRPVHALVGARFVRAMAASGIGVVSTAVPVQYLDVEFFDEIAEG